MKKSMGFVLAALLAVGMPLMALAETMYVNTPNGGSVNMRSGPSADDPVVTSIPYGAGVEILEYLYGSGWINAAYDGYYGYIASRYLTEYPPVPNPPWPTFAPAPTARPNPTHSGNGSLEKTLAEMYKGFNVSSFDAVVVPSTPTTYVNLRWAPSKSAPVRAQYWAGSTLHVISENGSWAEVYDPVSSRYGFMMKNFLSPNGVGGGLGS